jgi:hypothetical protein
MRAILYTVAKLESGELVRAVDANKGMLYYCPICSGVMHLRKSGKTGPNTKRPHFYHKSLTPNCTPESALHFAFKNLAWERINKTLGSNEPLPFSWNCSFCRSIHTGNLLRIATSIRLEHPVGQYTPDITLVDSNNQVVIVIEIVVTHAPEGNALAYYKKNNIPVIQIKVTSDADLDLVAEKIAKPDIVSVCSTNPRCETCGTYKEETMMTIVESECDRCGEIIQVAMIYKSFTTLGPNRFTPTEIAIARENGVFLKEHSWYRGKEQLINACRRCGQEVERGLFGHYFSPAECGALRSKSIRVGYHCATCFEKQFYS